MENEIQCLYIHAHVCLYVCVCLCCSMRDQKEWERRWQGRAYNKLKASEEKLKNREKRGEKGQISVKRWREKQINIW